MSKTFSSLAAFGITTALLFTFSFKINSAELESADEKDFQIDDTPDSSGANSTIPKANSENESPQKTELGTAKRIGPEVGLGLGTMTQFFRKVQTNTTGSKNNFKFEPYFSAVLRYPFSERFSFLPSAGLTIPHTGRDDNITKMTYYLLGEAAVYFENLSFKGGPGLSMTYYKGKGGEARLNNGNGYTSFSIPSGTATTRNVILSLGTEYRFLKEWAAQFQTMIFNPHQSNSRAVTYTLSAVLFIGLGD